MNSAIWYFPIFALVNAGTSTVLGLYLVFTSFKKRVVRYLFFFCAAVAAWSYCYFIWQIAKDAESALFWSRMLMFGAIFTSIFYLHLVLVFLELDKEKFYRIILAIFYFFSFVWVGVNFTTYFVAGIEPLSYFKYWPIRGPFYTPYLIAFFSHVIYASVLLFKHYRKMQGTIKIQTALLLLGLFLAFVGGSTNYPLWYHIDVAPWGNALVSIYVILTVYAMMKYKFMDMKVITAELFVGLMSIIFLIEIFFSKSITETIFRVVALLFVMLFSVMLVRSVRREIQRREEVATLAHSLESANLRLQELDRQKTDFLSIASHQLRTPLSILKGYIELLKDGAFGKPTSQMTKILNDMDVSNEHLVKLVDEFLDITRIEQGRVKYTFTNGNINNLISNVVKELSDRAKQKDLKLSWEPNKEIGKVSLDEEKIHHVVFNFVDNAIKYTNEGKIEIILEKENNGLNLMVRDSGLGFGPEDEANFFTKFYRGKNVVGTNVNGTGLGLFVCKKFIEAHGGRVWAKSDGLGKGSEFGFWIPTKNINKI